jgi:hypothetical protein
MPDHNLLCNRCGDELDTCGDEACAEEDDHVEPSGEECIPCIDRALDSEGSSDA